MRLLDDLTLSPSGGRRVERAGTTSSGEPSVASATEWQLLPAGCPPLTVHDNQWANGERDLVLYKPAVVPEMPAALSNLHNRLRSTLSRTPGRTQLRIMIYPTYVDPHERPRIKKSLTTGALADRVGLHRLRELTVRKGVTLEPAFDRPDLPPVNLEDPQYHKPLQHALFFPAEDEETPVAAFSLFRVVPVLRHIGWLAPDGS